MRRLTACSSRSSSSSNLVFVLVCYGSAVSLFSLLPETLAFAQQQHSTTTTRASWRGRFSSSSSRKDGRDNTRSSSNNNNQRVFHPTVLTSVSASTASSSSSCTTTTTDSLDSIDKIRMDLTKVLKELRSAPRDKDIPPPFRDTKQLCFSRTW